MQNLTYWQKNLRLILRCLVIWFVVSYGFGLLLVEPLNEPYQRVLQIKEELGLDQLFILLFAKFDQLEEELFDGLDRSAAAFGSLLSAMPV